MLDVMPNGTHAPNAATPMAWPTLLLVVCTPPDCAASLSLGAESSYIVRVRAGMPLPRPPRRNRCTYADADAVF